MGSGFYKGGEEAALALDTEEGRFIRALIDANFSREVRVQYADWLEEQGRPGEAARMRQPRLSVYTNSARRKHQKKKKRKLAKACPKCGERNRWKMGRVPDSVDRAVRDDPRHPLHVLWTRCDDVPVYKCPCGYEEARPLESVLRWLEDQNTGCR